MDDGATRKNSVDELTRMPGAILSDRYEVVELVGEGGMGTVYKARHTLIGNIVAIKVMHPHLLKDAASQERFKAEAKAAMGLRHERLMSVSDYGLTSSGQPFIVMEFVQGKGLDALLTEQKFLDTEEFFEIFTQVCDGLAHVHDKGIVHRDVKPSNIMLTKTHHEKWLVHIVDFGIAKVLPTGKGAVQHLTQTGEIFGSPLYMSPEQCKGREVDARSDIYSLGCVMFEALTGSPPHQGESAIETLMLHVNDKAPKLVDRRKELINCGELEKIVAGALSTAPESRYQTMQQLKEDLEQRKFSGRLPVISGSSNGGGGGGGAVAGSGGAGIDRSSETALDKSSLKDYSNLSASGRSPATFKSLVLSSLLIIAAAAGTVLLINVLGVTQPRVVITGGTTEQNLREADLEFQLAKEKAAQGFIPEASEYSQKALDLRTKYAPGTLLLAESMNQRADLFVHDAQHESLMLKGKESTAAGDSESAASEKRIAGDSESAVREKRIVDDYSNAETLLKSAISIADAKTSGVEKSVDPVRFRNILATAYLDQRKYHDAETTLNELSELFLNNHEPDKTDPESVQRTFHELFDDQFERLYWGTGREVEAAKIRVARHYGGAKYDESATVVDTAQPFTGLWSAGAFTLDLRQDGKKLSGDNEIAASGFDKGTARKNTVTGTVEGSVASLTCTSASGKGQEIKALAVRTANVLVFHLIQSSGVTEDAYVPDNAILDSVPTEAEDSVTTSDLKKDSRPNSSEVSSPNSSEDSSPNSSEVSSPNSSKDSGSNSSKGSSVDSNTRPSRDAETNAGTDSNKDATPTSKPSPTKHSGSPVNKDDGSFSTAVET